MTDDQIIEPLYKHTNEQYYIGFEYISPDIESGETITACDVTVSPVGLTLSGAAVITGNEVAQFIAGGVSGTSYIVTFKTTISSGNIFVDEMRVHIK